MTAPTRPAGRAALPGRRPCRAWEAPPCYVLVPARVAGVLLTVGGLHRYLRDHAGQDPETDLVVLLMTLGARNYAASGSGHPATPATSTADDQLVSTTDAARTFGVSVRTITRWITRGRLPAAYVGSRYAIHVADLDVLARSRAA